MRKTVQKRRQLKFDEINTLGKKLTSWEEAEGMSREEIEKRKEAFHDCLIDFLVDGFATGLLFIGEDKDLPDPYKFLDITYQDGETPTDKFLKYLKSNDSERMQVLIEAEANRMFNAGEMEAVDGIECTKTWVTMRDNRVRNTHYYIDNVTIPVNEEFVTIDGDSALAPGGFKDPENNVNCRCYLEFTRSQQE